MKKRILSVLMALGAVSNAPARAAWAAEDTLSGGTIVQEEQEESTPATSEQAVEDASEGWHHRAGGAGRSHDRHIGTGDGGCDGGGTIVQEEQEKAPAAESPAISEQAEENGIAAQNGGDSTVENAVAEVTIDGTTTQYANIDAAFAAAQQAGSAR